MSPIRVVPLCLAAAFVLAACGTPTPPGAPVDADADRYAARKATMTAIKATMTAIAATVLDPLATTLASTPGVPVDATAPSTAQPDGAAVQCRAWTTAPPNTTLYMQPSEGAPPFAEFGADSGIEAIELGTVLAQTDDGWYALDPGVAQAGNVGIYRLRWVLGSASQIVGSCGALPTIDVTPDTSPPAGGACEVTATAEVMVREQYAPDAAEFGPLPAGNTETALARTADGWLGFDPGIAQAGNIGLYRLRWIAPDAAVTTAGDCAGLAVVFGGA